MNNNTQQQNNYKQQALAAGTIGLGTFGTLKGLKDLNIKASNHLLDSSAQKLDTIEKDRIKEYYKNKYKKTINHMFVTETTSDGKPMPGIGNRNYVSTMGHEANMGNSLFEKMIKAKSVKPDDKIIFVNVHAPSAIAAHEMSHAYNPKFVGDSYFFGKKLMTNSHKVLPVAMAGSSLIKDKDKRHKANYALAGIASAGMLPTFLEETKANLQASKVLKDLKINRLKGGNLKALIGSQLSYTVPVALPFLAAGAANKISDHFYKQ